MRAALLVVTLLATVPTAFAQQANELELAVTATASGGHINVTVTLPVDQLRFVDDGSELFAVYSITATENDTTTPATDYPRRITAPKGTVPQGQATFRFELPIASNPTSVTITVLDENAASQGTRTLTVEGMRVTVVPTVPDGGAAWRDALGRAKAEQKPIVIFYRTTPCTRCRDFERISVPHPTIQRRLPKVVFAILPAPKDPEVVLYDRAGVARARWPIIPDTSNFGVILDSVAAIAPDLERAVQRAESGSSAEGDLELATALARLGFPSEARAALARAAASPSAETRQAAALTGALLDVREGKADRAMTALQQIATNAETPKLAADAQRALAALRAARAPAERGALHILPLERQLVSGKHTVRTHIPSAAVARVTFSLDGRDVRRVERPPFSTTIDFGDVPQTHTVRVVAYDRQGREIGRDERIVNEAGETFWLRLTSPAEGFAEGRVRVAMNLRAPATRNVKRITVSWNDADRAVLTTAPWDATVDIPAGEIGVLRAFAELDDGRTSEDAVLLNAGGMVGHSDVQLVQLPITIIRADGAPPQLTARQITVREGTTIRRVESIAGAAETPLTVGLVIDISGSMQKTLPDVQEAAIRFLETILTPRDRAFLIAFDSRARLVQPATADLALLRRRLMAMRPDGLTALNDALVLGLLQFEGIKGRRALIVFSDGYDVTSQYTTEDVSELARRVSVPIHAIASIQDMPAQLDATTPVRASSAAAATDDDLQRLARATGGTAHRLDTLPALPSIYTRIEAALRAQLLAFIRTDPATRENEWRSIKVDVKGDALEVFAPEGYYAAW
jgi:VWFA-related protein